MTNDVKELQNLVLQQQEILRQKDLQIEELSRQITLMKKVIYGRKSESVPAPEDNSSQPDIFADDQVEATAEEKAEEAKPPAKPRRRGGRKPLPKALPRKDIVIDVLAEDLECGCDCKRVCIGEDVTERLCYIPQKLYVERIIRRKYACATCKDAVIQAPLPPHILPRSGVGVSLLANLVVGKYMDHLPLCRIERIFARQGIDIDRGLMSDWLMKLSEKLLPLIALMKLRLTDCYVLGADETPLKMQGAKGEKGLKRCQMWVYNGDDGAPFTLFDFQQTRGRDGPADILKKFGGILQTDGYSVYQSLEKSSEYSFKRAGCMAHARRKFVEARDCGNKGADRAIELFQQLYAIEKKLKEINAADRTAYRNEHACPILEELHDWLLSQISTLPGSALGKAIDYTLNNWKELNVYLEDGRIPIDNNAVERAIRPIALGRKNWLFAGSPRGGQAAAIFMTLLTSAMRNGLNPADYLTDVLERLPTTAESDLPQLLPDAWTPPAK